MPKYIDVEEVKDCLWNWLLREAKRLGVPFTIFDQNIDVSHKDGRNDSVALVITVGKPLQRLPFYNPLGVWGTFEELLVICRRNYE